MFIDRWMDKSEVHTHTQNRTPLSHKKELNNATCSNMDAPRDDQTVKSDREWQISSDIAYMQNLKTDTNDLFTK